MTIGEIMQNIKLIRTYCDNNIFRIVSIDTTKTDITLYGDNTTYPYAMITISIEYRKDKAYLCVYVSLNSRKHRKKLEEYIYTLLRETKITKILT